MPSRMMPISGTISQEASDFAEAFEDGWNRRPPRLDQSDAMKAALAKQGELFGKLAARKAELEAEDAAALATKDVEDTKPTAPEKKPAPPPPQEMLIKFESGSFGFGEITKSIQDSLLTDDTDQKLVAQGEEAGKDRKDMKKTLESIDSKVGEEAPVATT